MDSIFMLIKPERMAISFWAQDLGNLQPATCNLPLATCNCSFSSFDSRQSPKLSMQMHDFVQHFRYILHAPCHTPCSELHMAHKPTYPQAMAGTKIET